MVWRDNTKVLGLRTKPLPLVVSALMHMAVIFGLSMASYNSEKVFTVDLIFQDTEGNLELKVRSGTHADRITKKTVGRLTKNHSSLALPIRQRELPSEGMELKTAIAYKPEALPPGDKQNPLSEYDKDMYVSHDMGKGYRGERVSNASGIGKGEAGLKEKWSNAGNEIVEGEFGSINAPSFLKMIKPEYPRLARRLGKEGKVILRLFIDEHGRLLSLEIVEKAGHGFVEAAVDAVRASTFRPAKLNGHPVACKAVLPVRFKLE